MKISSGSSTRRSFMAVAALAPAAFLTVRPLSTFAAPMVGKRTAVSNLPDNKEDIMMPARSQSEAKKFRLEKFFRGRCEGNGYTVSRSGSLQNKFRIEAEGNWDAKTNTLSLKEEYLFGDGHIDILKWSIIKRSETRYVGKEDRIDGEADGDEDEQSFRWRYVRSVPAKDGTSSKIRFDDHFWPQGENTLLVYASLTKFGIEVGRISAVYRKL
jgi:hypothetical protein